MLLLGSAMSMPPWMGSIYFLRRRQRKGGGVYSCVTNQGRERRQMVGWPLVTGTKVENVHT
jgi:hypothetical protein